MKIKIIVLIIFLFGGFALKAQNELYESFVENIMVIWTKIDIVRAINTDNNHKNIFLEELIDHSLNAYYLSQLIKVVPEFFSGDCDKDMVNLIAYVQESFEEVFHPVKNDDFHVFCFVLQQIVNLLKTPENVESEITAQYTC